ncbi:hypothetical protein JXA84_07295 [candidate division WOR-3 bacterium]|nr:hypothetical protein [candidate division WOR-3 bacterium]
MRNKKKFQLIFCLAFLLALLVVAAYIFQKRTFKLSKKQNGIWLAHHWVDEKPDQYKVARLADNLRKTGIIHVFQHAGPLDSLGNISPSKYCFSREFITELKRIYPELISVQAWIGQIEKRGGGSLDITSEQIRKNIAKTCAELVKAGFDGIHVDIEPIYEGDTCFVILLEEIRKSLGEEAVLTCAVPKISLGKIFGESLKLLFSVKGLWSAEYFQTVSKNTDFTVVMLYDTRIKNPHLYSLFVSLEVTKITRAAENPVMVGIPSYEDEKSTFDPVIENVEAALEAVFSGLKYGDREKYMGFSIYADWTMDEQEWKTVQRHVESEKLYE